MTGRRLIGLAGTVSVVITGACPETVLGRMAEGNVRFRDLKKLDELSFSFVIADRDLRIVAQYAKKCMCSIDVTGVSGLVPLIRAMGLRALYILLLAGLVCLVFYLQGFIWFISVSGNETLPTEEILWTLEDSGVHFFTRSDAIDLNVLKNQVLRDIPDLAWITINTQGGWAEVVVRERASKPVITKSAAPANVVAKKDSLIVSVDVTGGTAAVKPGDVVKAGQLLISGVTNLDKTLLLTRAQGEVYARTWNTVCAIAPDNQMEKVYTGRQSTYFTLTFGKKTINLYKTSGISYHNYDKIMDTSKLTLPGDVTFPVALTKVTFREYVLQPVAPETGTQLAEQAALRQIRQGLTAGQILAQRFAAETISGGWSVTGVVECQEEIGTVVEIKD